MNHTQSLIMTSIINQGILKHHMKESTSMYKVSILMFVGNIVCNQCVTSKYAHII